VNSSLFWLVWFEVLAVLGSLSQARRTADEPDEGRSSPLDLRTRAVATLGLALLAGLLQERSSPAPWVAWFVGLGVLLTMETRWGALRASSTAVDHPPTGATPLGRGRAALAIVTLALFVLLFMPTPIGL
jgi:hypothetical protein